jgi:hypothetical protein
MLFWLLVLEARTPGEAWVPWTNHGEPIDLIIAKAFLNNGSTSESSQGFKFCTPQIRAAIFRSDEAAAQIPDITCEYAILKRPFQWTP